VRFWTTLLGPYWAGREVTPTASTLASFLEELRALGLQAVLSQGDGMRWDRKELLWILRQVVLTHARDIAVLDAGNETWQNGEPDPAKLAAFLREVGFDGLQTLSSPPDEPLELMRAWSVDPANLMDAHSQTAEPLGNIRRIFNVGYEAGARRHGIQSEPRGPGRNVSVTQISSVPVLKAMAIASLMSRQAYVYMSSPGVISDGQSHGRFDAGERFRDMPGFREVAQVTTLLPQDLTSFRDLYHGGERWAARRKFAVANVDTRCDHAEASDGRTVALCYGGPYTHVRGEIMTFHDLGENIHLYTLR
jgi:hypothetical protein